MPIDAKDYIADGEAFVRNGEDIDGLELPTLASGTRWTPDLVTSPGNAIGNVLLSAGVAGGDTLNGGTAASETLTLGSTAHATRGLINVRDNVSLISEDKTPTGTAVPLINVSSSRTLTFSNATASQNQIKAFQFNATVVYGATSALFAGLLFNAQGTLKNDAGNARTIQTFDAFTNFMTLQADGATASFTGTVGLADSPTIGVINSGTATVIETDAVTSGLTVGASCTVTTRRGVAIADSTGSGTVTTAVGIDILALSHAGTSIGIRNASTTVDTPTTKTITAVSDTIPITATAIRLNNTSGSSKTLTSTPTLAAGQNGQIIRLFNSSANDVVLNDEVTTAGTTLQLGAVSRTLGTNDTITLMYSTTLSMWLECAFSNN